MKDGSDVNILPAHWQSLTAIVESVGFEMDTLRADFLNGK